MDRSQSIAFLLDGRDRGAIRGRSAGAGKSRLEWASRLGLLAFVAGRSNRLPQPKTEMMTFELLDCLGQEAQRG